MAEVLEQIQQQIEDLTAAISKLSDRVKGLEHAEGVTRSPNEVDTKCSHCNEKPVRESGYVNWDESHNFIKNMKLSNCDSSLSYNILYAVKCNRNRAIIINENTQFPEHGLYINVSDPKVLYEMNYNKTLFDKAVDQQLVTLFMEHMHTRYSFEEKYKLKWVDPKEQSFDIKEDKKE